MIFIFQLEKLEAVFKDNFDKDGEIDLMFILARVMGKPRDQIIAGLKILGRMRRGNASKGININWNSHLLNYCESFIESPRKSKNCVFAHCCQLLIS